MQLEMKRRNREARLKKDADQAREARRWNAKLEDEEIEAVRALRRRDEAHQDFLAQQIHEKSVARARTDAAELEETVNALGSYKDEESTLTPRPASHLGFPAGPPVCRCIVRLIVIVCGAAHVAYSDILRQLVVLLYTQSVKFHTQLRREISKAKEQGKNPYPIVQCYGLKEDLLAA